MTMINKLRSLRISKGLSINELARLTNLSPAMLSRIARGLREPSWHTADKIAAALGVPLEEIFPQFANRKSPLPKVAQR